MTKAKKMEVVNHQISQRLHDTTVSSKPLEPQSNTLRFDSNLVRLPSQARYRSNPQLPELIAKARGEADALLFKSCTSINFGKLNRKNCLFDSQRQSRENRRTLLDETEPRSITTH